MEARDINADDLVLIGGCLFVDPGDDMIQEEIARLQAQKTDLQGQHARHAKVVKVQRAHQTILQNTIAEHGSVIRDRQSMMARLHEGIKTIDKQLATLRAHAAKGRDGRK